MGSDPRQDEELNSRFAFENFARAAQSLAVLANTEEKEVLQQYAKYLLGEKPRSYPALAEYLEWYGRKFLLPIIKDVMTGHRYEHIIELGPGTGWLIKELRPYVPLGGTMLAIDKRDSFYKRSSGIHFSVLDLEDNSFERFLPTEYDPKQTLIVANQFLHCVENRNQLVNKNRAVWLVVEVTSQTWRKQIAHFGGGSLSPHELMELFHEAHYHLYQQKRTSTLSISLWHQDD